jgi:hypothetical protein
MPPPGGWVVENGCESGRIDDLPVEKAHLPLAWCSDIRLVGDHHDGDALAVERIAEQRHDFLAGVAVEVAGRLVGEDQARLVDQRPGDRDALLLAAGNAVGQRFGILAEADLVEHDARARLPRCLVHAGIDQRQGDIVLQAHARQQVEALEDEADGAVAQDGQRVLSMGDVLAGQAGSRRRSACRGSRGGS